RDFHVTGVQTCALPICALSAAGSLREKVMEVTHALSSAAGDAFSEADRQIAARAEAASAALLARADDIARAFQDADERLAARAEIGRASCRETGAVQAG